MRVRSQVLPAHTTDLFSHVWDALTIAAAFGSASRLGILSRLDGGPVDPATLAQDCGLDERGVQALLAALAGIGLVEGTAAGAYTPAFPGLTQLSSWCVLLQGLVEGWRPGR